jgi:glycosyltransferase involved in cell wall biosynthesis
MKKNYFIILLFLNLFAKNKIQIIGGGINYKGLENIGLNLFNILHQDYEIKYSLTTGIDLKVFDEKFKNAISESISNKNTNHDVAIYTTIIGSSDTNNNIITQTKLIENAQKKIAISMLECNPIPDFWVEIINKIFDHIIVPCQWVKDTYLESGVKKPITVIPLIVDEPKLKKTTFNNKEFIFGSIGGLGEDKNLHKVAQAFGEIYGNNPRFKLILKISSNQNEDLVLTKKIEVICNKYRNIQLIWGFLKKEKLEELMIKFDCFVLASRGEGFSLIPRQAMKMNIPCLISYNSAHKELCDLKLATPIYTDIKTPSNYRCFGNFLGTKYDCTINDIKLAMKDFVKNYQTHVKNLKQNQSLTNLWDQGVVKQQLISLINELLI